VSTQAQSGAPAETTTEVQPATESDPVALTAAWIAGPHPAALVAIETAPEDIETPVAAPTRVEASDGSEDHVRMYLREIGTVPLLTWDGEKRLARAMESGVYLQDVVRPHAADASVRAMYRQLYSRVAVVYRYIVAEARIESPDVDGQAAFARAARASDVDPEHLRHVAELLESPLDVTEKALLEASIVGNIVPPVLSRWCADHEAAGELPDAVVFEADFLTNADPDDLDEALAEIEYEANKAAATSPRPISDWSSRSPRNTSAAACPCWT